MSATITPSPSAARRPRKRPWRPALPRLSGPLIGLAAIAAFLLVWQLVTSSSPYPYFPPLGDILANAKERWLGGSWHTLWLGPEARTEIGPSLARMSVAWVIAVAGGVGIGFLFGLLGKVGDYFEPAMHFARSLPPTTLIPVFLLILGVGDSMKIVFIATTVVWPIVLNTMDGVRAVEPAHLEAARAYGIGRVRVLTSIVLPSALPKIIAGLRISLSLALILMVISEMVAATNGIGFQILSAQRTFRILDMWSGIIVLSVIGVVLNLLVGALEHHALRWHRGARANTV